MFRIDLTGALIVTVIFSIFIVMIAGPAAAKQLAPTYGRAACTSAFKDCSSRCPASDLSSKCDCTMKYYNCLQRYPARAQSSDTTSPKGKGNPDSVDVGGIKQSGTGSSQKMIGGDTGNFQSQRRKH